MDISAVPQEDNATLSGHRKAVYARDDAGRLILTTSSGWEAEEIVTTHAVAAIDAQAQAARDRANAGLASPLEYWMYARRMDVALLAQSCGYWRWQVRRHLQPAGFARLTPRRLAVYAHVLGISTDTLRLVP